MGRIVVAGSINMDVVAIADRHPAIGETVTGREVLYFPGGKGANQAVAAAKLGAATMLIGCTGADAFGRDTRTFLAVQGVDLAHLREVAGVGTGTAIITVANADNTIVVVPGANALVSMADVAAPALRRGDVAVSQFEIPLPAITAFFTQARASGAITILNPAPAMPIDHKLMALVDVLILNESELGLLAGVELHEADPDARFVDAASTLQTDHRPNICVTLGRRGVIALVDGEIHLEAARLVKAIDTTGAGDCFVGAVAARLADGHSLQSAIGYANVAASLCVQRMGAGPSMPTAEEVSAAAG
ncbi:ribokinase [Bradyrhizobium sp. NFR13]|jgi:ribokinase|uniref:ribokinase n=1 Tax=Bradyrhizobium sp. NFR13 TaxID=1566285 RepID=UPI0008EC37EB|nr:ribokinase [Bradyrhizobium sp. NFR13]SFL98473.1 ribokinase [Bradyrhizobium sp. NFR13]